MGVPNKEAQAEEALWRGILYHQGSKDELYFSTVISGNASGARLLYSPLSCISVGH